MYVYIHTYIYIHTCTNMHAQTATDLAVLLLDVEHSQKTTLKSFWILNLAASSNPRICTWRDETGWRRPIGCLALQVAFRKRATNYRALLRKMTHTDKASDGSSPPCSSKRQAQIFWKISNAWRLVAGHQEDDHHCLEIYHYSKYHPSMLQGGEAP